MNIFLLLASVFVVLASDVNAQSCQTVEAGEGECKSLYECPSLYALVSKPDRTPQDDQLLKKSQCGYKGDVPAVCCPRPCYTPEGVEGKCIALTACPQLANLLKKPVAKENVAYVRKFVCTGREEQSVCCPPAASAGSTGSAVIPQTGPVKNCNDVMTAFPPDKRTKCCGLDSSAGNKIVGGNVTGIEEYPWLVVIEYVRLGITNLFCGGSLISGKYVLTAGHCVAGQILDYGTPKNVRLGEFDTSNNGPDCVRVEAGGTDCTDGVTIVAIEKTIPHPEYRPDSFQRRHDIALIRLKSTAQYTYFIRPICLPTRDYLTDPPTPFKMWVAGWGRFQQFANGTNRSSKLKQHVELPHVDTPTCQSAQRTLRNGDKLELWRGQICAGGEPGKDSCKGDSGGPLMYSFKRVFELVGMVSFGPEKCGQPNIPGVYSNIYEYIPWISSTITP